MRRRQRLGDVGLLVGSKETLDEYVARTWAPAHAVRLAPRTARTYALVYDRHIGPYLGATKLGGLTPELVARWQAERIASGAGRTSVLKAPALLGAILQRALEAGRVGRNPARLVRKATPSPRKEGRPLAPVTVEALRAVSSPRGATLISVMAYAGLRPQEALALRWKHVGERTLTIYASKTRARRSVRLLAPLAEDLRAWREASGDPGGDALVFPAADGEPWSEEAYKSWASAAPRGRKRADGSRAGTGGAFGRAMVAAGVSHASPYTLRHSFCSLLLHEARSVIYVARQLGHDAQMTLLDVRAREANW